MLLMTKGSVFHWIGGPTAALVILMEWKIPIAINKNATWENFASVDKHK